MGPQCQIFSVPSAVAWRPGPSHARARPAHCSPSISAHLAVGLGRAGTIAGSSNPTGAPVRSAMIGLSNASSTRFMESFLILFYWVRYGGVGNHQKGLRSVEGGSQLARHNQRFQRCPVPRPTPLIIYLAPAARLLPAANPNRPWQNLLCVNHCCAHSWPHPGKPVPPVHG